MKQADTDPFPRKIEIRKGRRRTVQLSLEGGRLVARVPEGADGARIGRTLATLRAQLWRRLRRESAWTDEDLTVLAHRVRSSQLADLDLPPWTVRFSRRQHKRWGSCTFDGSSGRIRLSAHLIGHPSWVIAQVLLHELIHLVVHDHGPVFQALMRRSPDHERGQGYLEALETIERIGPRVSLPVAIDEDDTGQKQLFARD